MSDVSLYLFGAPRVEQSSANVPISRRKALALLAYLAASERTHSRDNLAALLWPEWDTTSARTALRRVLVTANKALGVGVLLAEQKRLGLAPEAGLWVDVVRFRAVLAQSRSHHHTHLHTCNDCLGWLSEAADLYTGDFLAGFGLDDSPDFDDWTTFEAESLRRDAAEVLEKLTEIHATGRDFSTAIAVARRWLSLDPLHEAAHRMLMRLYAWAGDQAAALRQYRECLELLQRELGVPPQSETTELFEQVKVGQVVVQGLPIAPLVPTPAQVNMPQTVESFVRLPHLTDFMGRRVQLATLGALLPDPSQRLITVLGMGGMGKTSLAVVAAGRATDRFPDGVAFVPLAPLSQPSAIVSAIADVLGYTFPPDSRPPLQQLTGYLSSRRLLLVLDNFEHLLDGAEIVAALLEGAPDVTCLVTSREPLQLRAETIFALEGMEISDEEGLRLFAQSARRVRSDYTPQPEEKAAIEEICRLVDGMPLGIVLAAAWIGLLSPQEIVIEIRQGLSLLVTELRDVPERQRSLRAVMEQTWAGLDDAERDALMRLSIFRGGITRDAAQVVTGVSLRTLLSLANRQLLQRTAEARYDIHELLRQFAAERLAEASLLDAATKAHGNYFVELLERSEAELKGADQGGALARLRAEQENIRMAWVWALDHRQADGLAQAVEALSLFYFLEQRRSEALETFRFTEGRLAETAPNSVSLARLLVWYARFCQPVGQMEKGKILCRRSLQILDSLAGDGQDMRRERAFVLCELGGAIWYENTAEARQFLEDSVALCRAVDDPWQLARALREFARLLLAEGDFRLSEEMAAEALDIRQKLGDQRQLPSLLSILCWATLHQGQTDRALAYAQEHTEMGERFGYPEVISVGQFLIGNVCSHAGEYDKAQRALLGGLALIQQYEHRHHANSCRWQLADIYAHTGHYQAAYDLAQLAVAEADAIGLRNHRGHLLRSVGMAETVWARCAEALGSFEESVAIFQTIRQLRLLAYAQVFLAYGYYCSGARQHAVASLFAALDWATDHPSSITVTAGLPLAALLCADAGQPERAIELHALATSYPRIANSRWFYDIAGRELEALAASLPPEVVAAAQDRGRALDLYVTAQELVERFGNEET